jgi:hypothetical protein
VSNPVSCNGTLCLTSNLLQSDGDPGCALAANCRHRGRVSVQIRRWGGSCISGIHTSIYRRERGRGTGRQGDRERERQGDRQTGRQADRETERHPCREIKTFARYREEKASEPLTHAGAYSSRRITGWMAWALKYCRPRMLRLPVLYSSTEYACSVLQTYLQSTTTVLLGSPPAPMERPGCRSMTPITVQYTRLFLSNFPPVFYP